MTDISIIIVNWNTKDILRDCLNSVFNQPRSIEQEVIVVDNASSDGSVEMIKARFPQVVLIANPDNRGFAAGNNQGMAVAKGRYVLLLNSDTVVLDDAITKSLQFADQHPEAAVVGCRVLNPDRTLQLTCFMYPSLLNQILSSTYLYKIFPRSRFWGRERMTWWDRSDQRQVQVVTGCFMLVRKTAIDQVGVMDESYFMYGEETDWCYRFEKAGWKNLFTPAAQIIHLGGASSKKNFSQMRLQLAGSLLMFQKKYRSWLTYRLSCLFMSLFFWLRIPYWALKAAVDSAGRSKHKEAVRLYWTCGLKSLIGVEAMVKKRV